MKVDVEKLKNKILQSKFTNDAFAKIIGMNQSTLYRKLKSDGDAFLVKELYIIIDVLKLTKVEVYEIFFSNDSHLR